MQIRLFTIPLGNAESDTEELNHFLRSHRVVDVGKQLVTAQATPCWTFCVTYMDGAASPEKTAPGKEGGKRERVDYRDVLEEHVFARFAVMRKVRKEMADRLALPPYVILTDAEMAEGAKLDPLTPQGMAKVDGIGKGKMEKYGMEFIEKL